MSKRKPYNNKAGYVASRRNDINQGWVVIYVAADQGIDTSDGKYAVVCEKHSTICNTSSIPKARPFLKRPEFCEECMSEARGKETYELSRVTHAQRHEAIALERRLRTSDR